MIFFRSTVFLSSFLLFLVQPLLAKFILPRWGGAPAVWTACMLFYQVALCGGYLYAHLLSSRRFKHQLLIHSLLVIASLITLPIAPDPSFQPASDSSAVLQILLLLLGSVGLPYTVLSATNPLLQSWFSTRYPQGNPYPLFSLSNIASLGALLCYPFVVERLWPLSTQASIWSVGFGIFSVSIILTALSCRNNTAQPSDSTTTIIARPSSSLAAVWLIQSATGSALMLAITNYVCSDLAAIPLLWIIPLALYLLTYIIAFDSPHWYSRRFILVTSLVLAVSILRPDLFPFASNRILLMIVGLFFAMFLGCMVCHGELALLKPDKRFLTGYYLCIAIGGALGGTFVSVISPLLFTSYFELPLALLLTVIILALGLVGRSTAASNRNRLALAVFASIFAFGTATAWHQHRAKQPIAATRNFFGILRVEELNTDDPSMHRRSFVHGSTIHGTQFIDPQKRHTRTTYFGEHSGIGRVFAKLHEKGPLHVGILGLGAGTLASYARPGDRFRYYEIDPDVTDFAKKHFSFLDDCRGELTIVTGDGRLMLERDPTQGFDLLALDAFSGDSVPVHLITSDAFEIYLRQIKPDGVIVANISNRYIDLYPVLANIAAHFNLKFGLIETSGEISRGTEPSQYVVLTAQPDLLSSPGINEAITTKASSASIPLWTDEYSNLFQVLR